MSAWTRDEAKAITAKVAEPGGAFVAATCPRCFIVKRPLRDTSSDDGNECAECQSGRVSPSTGGESC